MEEVSLRFRGAIFVSLFLGLVLTILPVNDALKLWRPEWLALTIIHWGLVLPEKLKLWLIWLFGILVDILYGSLLGQHALGFTLVYYVTVRMRPSLLANNLLHEFSAVIMAIGTYLLINLWILGLTGNSPNTWQYWLLLLASIIVWPFYHYFLKVFHYRVKLFD